MLQLRGSVHIEYTLARMGAERLWKLINEGGDSYVHALGALTGALCVCVRLVKDTGARAALCLVFFC